MQEHLNGWQRFNPEIDHPQERCMSGRGPGGECPYKRVPGSNYCPRHGGNKALESQRNEERRSYQLGKYQARYREFATDPGIKSLREEIGVTRMLLEEVFNRINSSKDGVDQATLMIMLPKLESLIEKIRKLVESCDRIETKMGQTLDRNQIMNIGGVIINVIGQHINDPDILDTIGEEIIQAIIGPQTNVATS